MDALLNLGVCVETLRRSEGEERLSKFCVLCHVVNHWYFCSTLVLRVQ